MLRQAAASCRTAQVALAFVAVLLVPSGVHAQTAFDRASAPAYLTYCLEASTGTVPSSVCDQGTYATLQGLITDALVNPWLLNETTLQPLEELCAQNCISQLLTMSETYINQLPALSGNESWCETVIDPNIVPLLQTTVPFMCQRNMNGSFCFAEVAQAMDTAGVLHYFKSVMANEIMFNSHDVDTNTLCPAMADIGCCGTTFADVLQAALQMTCHPDAAMGVAQIMSNCQGSPQGLPEGCNYHLPDFEYPETCPVGGLVLPAVGSHCPIPAESCPVTTCEFMCAVMAEDPPVYAPGVMQLHQALPQGKLAAVAAGALTASTEAMSTDLMSLRGAAPAPAPGAAAAVLGGLSGTSSVSTGGSVGLSGASAGGAAVGLGRKRGAQYANLNPGMSAAAEAEAAVASPIHSGPPRWVTVQVYCMLGVWLTAWLVYHGKAAQAAAQGKLHSGQGEDEALSSSAARRALPALVVLSLLVQTCVMPPLLCTSIAEIQIPAVAAPLGLALAYCATALFCASATTLMQRWDGGALGGAPRLVTWGPYRIVRHPMCLSVALLTVGLLLGTGMLLVCALLTVQLVLLVARISREERLLLQAYGDKYAEYQAFTSLVVPVPAGSTDSSAGPFRPPVAGAGVGEATPLFAGGAMNRA